MKIINYKDINAIFFDFDGVLTDNYFYLSEDNKEYVKLSRSDGLAFNIIHKLNIDCWIISTEKNPLPKLRAKKLKVNCKHGVKHKKKELINISKKNNYNLSKLIYVGNDINDIEAMKICKFKLCPKDSHKSIKKIADYVMKSKGGEGVARELIESYFNINIQNFVK